MSLSILNNISALTAENSLSNTQMGLQKSLTQLSTGLKINSGSDDSAGLSIANGMQANIAALTQSQQNASNGIGMLQTADGALSQVTTLLNRAVTLATEAASDNLTTGGATTQTGALNTEYQSILSEISQIGSTTNFNGVNVFSSNSPTDYTSASGGLSTSTVIASGKTITINDQATGGTFIFTGNGTKTIADLNTAMTAAVATGTLSAGSAATINANGQLDITNTASAGITVTTTDTSQLGAMNAVSSGGSNDVFISDGSTADAGHTDIVTAISSLTTDMTAVTGTDLNSTANAQSALTAINSAISTVSSQRGVIGASVNRLTAASNVMSNEVQNLQSASNNIQNADIGKTVANMTQYNILQSTGMSALQQANQAQQAVLKLLQ